MINIQAILIGNILSIVINIILLCNLPYDFTRDNLQAKVFTWFSIPIISGAIFGIGDSWFDGVAGPFARFMVTFCGSFGIIMPVLMGFVFWLYVESTGKVSFDSFKNKILIALIPTIITIALVIINIWNPVVFYVTENNNYIRGPLGLVAYIVGPVYIFIALSKIAYLKSKHRGFLFVRLAGVFIPIVVVGAIQVSTYGIIQSWMGLAVGMLALYIGMHKDILYTDSMTKVFNKLYLEYFMEKMQTNNIPVGGIMVDIDHFKSINDNHGHDVGDLVIKKVGKILKRSVDEETNVIRVGGDEFMIVSRSYEEKDIESIKENIRKNCKIKNEKKKLPVNIELSMGSAVYMPQTGSASEWLSLMDQRMYQEKARHHIERRGKRRASDGSSL